jgi:hypothetical protein
MSASGWPKTYERDRYSSRCCGRLGSLLARSSDQVEQSEFAGTEQLPRTRHANLERLH